MAYNLFALNRDGLPSLLEGVSTREDWEVKREEVRQIWLRTIGDLPDIVPPRMEVLAEQHEEDHIRQHIVYDTAHGDRVTAYLLIPLSAAEGEAGRPHSHPAVLALHPTHALGKDVVVFPHIKENRSYALELVKRGYVVLAPDALTAGERIYEGADAFNSKAFYEQHPEWTTVAKNITDHRQGVELLTGLPYVDPERIGAIGHSFGGYNAYFLATADTRVRAVVSSCGFSCFYGDTNPMHWGIRDWYTHLPSVTDGLARGMIPFDFHEIIALNAPTPFFNYSAQSDRIFPHWEEIGACMKDLYGLYAWLEAESHFESYLGVKGHDFPPGVRAMAYDFLDRWLAE